MNKLLYTLFRSPGKSSPAPFVIVLAGLFVSQFYAGTAYAASLTVAVQQVNPNNAVQTVTCTLLQKSCDLPFVINAGQPTQQSLNVHVVYFSGGLTLNFHTPNGYFCTQETAGKMVLYNTLWHRLLQSIAPATYTITLFQPLSPFMAPQPVAAPGTNYTPVANLKVTATPVP